MNFNISKLVIRKLSLLLKQCKNFAQNFEIEEGSRGNTIFIFLSHTEDLFEMNDFPVIRNSCSAHRIREYISLPSIVVTNRHSIVIAAEPSVITLVVNISTCNYNWKGLNEPSFTAHLYLSQYYTFRDHSVNFTVDLSQEGGVCFLIPQKLRINAPTLVTSASHKITAKCDILCPKTLLLTEKQLHAIHTNLLLDLYPPSNGIRMPGVSQRASRIFIRRARTATEARHANYFSVCTI